jgi:hypothetical protein
MRPETDTAVTTTTTSPTTTTIATNMVETYYSRNVFAHFFVKLDTVDQTPFLYVFLLCLTPDYVGSKKPNFLKSRYSFICLQAHALCCFSIVKTMVIEIKM